MKNYLFDPSERHDKVRYKQCLREMLCRVVEALKCSGVPYWGVFGTCLGAVRHRGMIPWDDDIDIAVTRNCFEAVVDCLRKSCPELYVWDWHLDDKCTLPYGRIFWRIDNKTTIEKYRSYIDIFIVDRARESRRVRRLESALLRTILMIIRIRAKSGCSVANYFSVSSRLWALRLALSPLLLMPNKLLHKIYGVIISVFSGRHCSQSLHEFGSYPSAVLPSCIFSSSELCEYEGIKIPIPADYEKYLTSLYGDWRTPPPVSKRVGYAWDKQGSWAVAMPDDDLRR